MNDPFQTGTPYSPGNDNAVSGPLFKWAWLATMAIVLLAAAIIIAVQIFG